MSATSTHADACPFAYTNPNTTAITDAHSHSYAYPDAAPHANAHTDPDADGNADTQRVLRVPHR